MKTKRLIPFAAIAFALILSACTSGSGVAGFWNKQDITITESNYREAEDRFARFAELAVKAPQEKALAGLDALMDKLKTDEVSYYVYSEWIVMAFHSLLSPCRNTELFSKAVERFSTDGVMSEDEYRPFAELAAKDRLNAPGTDCIIPQLYDANGAPAPWEPGAETLFLVVNLDCATCVAALHALADEPGEHIALCFGFTPAPSVPGWEYRYSNELGSVFDTEAAPFWFTVGADGKVVKPISPAPDYNAFATPDNK